MATQPKTHQMKIIIKEVAKLNPNIKALTYEDFTKGEAKELLNSYSDDKQILKQKELLHKIAQVPLSNIDRYIPSTKSTNISYYDHTAQFFGIDESMGALINKLSCEIYSNIIIDEMQLADGIIEDGYMHQGIKKSFDNWLVLCNKVDKFKKYMDTLNDEKKKQLKQGLNLVINAPFIEDNNIVNEFHYFISNYRLDQVQRFKINKLKELNLPNINDYKTAQKIHNSTKFRHNNK